MLFLLNDRIVEIDAPEIHLEKRWRVLGCGEPAKLMASEAIEFVQRVVANCNSEGITLDDRLVEDLSALIVAKTGANAAFVPTDRKSQARTRLTRLPEAILATLRAEAQNKGEVVVSDVWASAA